MQICISLLVPNFSTLPLVPCKTVMYYMKSNTVQPFGGKWATHIRFKMCIPFVSEITILGSYPEEIIGQEFKNRYDRLVWKFRVQTLDLNCQSPNAGLPPPRLVHLNEFPLCTFLIRKW